MGSTSASEARRRAWAGAGFATIAGQDWPVGRSGPSESKHRLEAGSVGRAGEPIGRRPQLIVVSTAAAPQTRPFPAGVNRIGRFGHLEAPIFHPGWRTRVRGHDRRPIWRSVSPTLENGIARRRRRLAAGGRPWWPARNGNGHRREQRHPRAQRRYVVSVFGIIRP